MTTLPTPMPTTTDLTLLAAAITREHEAAYGAARSALEHARRAGGLLVEAKTQIPHGDWLPWLAAHVPAVGARQAQKYMRLHEHWPVLVTKYELGSHLDIPIDRALALLIRPHGNDPTLPPVSVLARSLDRFDAVTAPQVIEEARWLAWELTWLDRTGESPPLRPRDLWRWMWGALLDETDCPDLPPVEQLDAWYVDCCLTVGRDVLLRTGKHPPMPPNWPRARPSTKPLGERGADVAYQWAWERYIEAHAGQFLNECGQLGWLDKKSNFRADPWPVNLKGARELLTALGAPDLNAEWSDAKVEQWARGYCAIPFVRIRADELEDSAPGCARNDDRVWE